ncbi:isopeptide-forming domain-containing fimbrial protein [Bifidobacterium aemilianum]|uniref:isopeptide-forming domain-containing fimbrial protein n=1 Tax=Bifidobacterium aemilianum TaxID=2493120 RepID=UPI001374B6CA|nr:isopeptide-forming domain-containing fimbrial protein [Bifidobacterium aemilianum]
MAVGTDSNVAAMATQALDDTFAAINASGSKSPVAHNPAYAGNPVGEVASLWLGFTGSDTGSNSREAAYNGHLRDFVTNLGKQSGFVAAEEASTYKADGPTAAATPTADDSISFSALPQGIYAVMDITDNKDLTPTTNSIPMLVGTAVAGHANCVSGGPALGVINIKSYLPRFKKELVSKSKTVSIGDVLTYHLTVSVPLTTGFQHYKYTITDKPSQAGLQIMGSPVVKTGAKGTDFSAMNTVDPTNDTYYSVTNNADGGATFDFSDKIMKVPYVFDNDIVIEYKMQITDAAKDGTGNLSNGARLEYSNDPNHGTTSHQDTGNDDTTKIYFYQFELSKVAKASNESLTGAHFTVANDSGAPMYFIQQKSDTGELIPGSYKKAKNQTGVAGTTTDLVVSDNSALGVAKGHLLVDGLGEGSYKVAETVQPTGYSGTFLPSFTETISVKGSDYTSPDYQNGHDTWNLVTENAASKTKLVTVMNVTSLSQLPMTGGAGIILAVLASLVFAGIAGSLVLVSKHQDPIQA